MVRMICTRSATFLIGMQADTMPHANDGPETLDLSKRVPCSLPEKIYLAAVT